jgi:hypothetical protein
LPRDKFFREFFSVNFFREFYPWIFFREFFPECPRLICAKRLKEKLTSARSAGLGFECNVRLLWFRRRWPGCCLFKFKLMPAVWGQTVPIQTVNEPRDEKSITDCPQSSQPGWYFRTQLSHFFSPGAEAHL